ncbi:MAG: ABC transporter ATP-binding protein, partial [Acutalibacteraceae bacterium]|nr:ABC transporter ATP-binding protein [Acutalibacteraceae bacterium]
IYMFMLSPKLALVILCGVPVLLAIIFLIKNAQKKSYFIYNNKNSNLTAYTCESINGVMVSQVFNRQDENTAIYKQLNMIYRKAWYKMCVWVNTLAPVSENLKQLVITFVYLAGILWISPSIEVGVLIAMTTYAGQFWQPIINLAAVYNNFLTAISYLERIFQTLDEPVEITDGENAKPLENMQGNVEFNNVCFAYEADKPVLENVSFSVEKGQSIALVGPTGSGKSTIVNLLSRFYNIDSGEILIDGVSISDITVHSLRSQMGIMLQDSFIFSGTIADNIRYGKLDATTDEIVAAAKAVCADEFIRSKPKGYDTVVNENGGGLSQGEKQLIAFARTMLSNPAILVLDEATSSIDPKTERLLQQGIANLLKGRTSFIIAHRLSTIKSCDNIMVIKNGGIFESGTHDELMSKKGEYYRLNMAQKSFD